MEVIFERSCGMDVHKETLTACIIISRNGKVKKKEIRTYPTMTEDIEELRDWLKTEGVTHVAMERKYGDILEADIQHTGK